MVHLDGVRGRVIVSVLDCACIIPYRYYTTKGIMLVKGFYSYRYYAYIGITASLLGVETYFKIKASVETSWLIKSNA